MTRLYVSEESKPRLLEAIRLREREGLSYTAIGERFGVCAVVARRLVVRAQKWRDCQAMRRKHRRTDESSSH